MADLTGKTLGKYRLVERLGRGGMAEVYKAYQPRLDRYVAVKVMHGYLAEDEDFVGRFQREAKAIAALHHPHIVQVHDFDIEEDIYYMVQEFVEGGTLKARLRQASEEGKPIPVKETVRILTAICDAVDYAHRQGRIHRDIKPDNIMFDANDRPVLTDFGIASIVGGTRFTATGAMVGTPAYMSPEQGKGYPGDVRSDVYSLGVVLYEMATGRIPFDADTPFAVVLKHVNEPLPMPRTLNPDVPPSIERVILKSLAKDPEDRYQTAAELAQALKEAFAIESQRAEMPSLSLDIPPEFVAAPPIIEELAAKEALAIQEPPAVSPEPPAVSPEPPAIGDTFLLPETPFPQAAAAPAQPAPVQTAPESTAKAKSRFKPWMWAVLVPAALLLLACCTFGGLRAIRQIRTNAQATQTAVVSKMTPSGKELISATAPSDKEPVSAAAPPADLQELLQQAEKQFNAQCEGDAPQAMTIYEQVITQYADLPHGYTGRAACHLCSGDNDAAQADLDKAIELDPNYPPAYYWLGRLKEQTDKEQEALADLTKAIELDPNYVEAYFWRGVISGWGGDSAQAFADYNKAIELAPDFALAYLHRGMIYAWDKDDAQAALTDLTRYIELQPDDPEGYAERANVYLDSVGDDEKAISDYTLAIERAPERPEFYRNRAEAYYGLGQFEQSLQDYDRAVTLSPDAETYFYRGMARYKAEQFDAALEDFDQVLLVGGDYDGGAHYGKGWTYFALGRYQEAIDAYNEAAKYKWDDYSWPFFEDTDLRLDRGIAYRENQQFDQSLDDLTALITERDTWAPGYFERALTYKAMKQPLRAIQDLRQAWEYAADQEELRARIEEELKKLQAGKPSEEEPALPDCKSDQVFCVGLVTDLSSIDDKSFNQHTWKGMQQAEAELGVVISYIESKDQQDYEKNLAKFADDGYDVIVVMGYTLQEATLAVATRYPDIKFIGVDQDWQGSPIPNVVGLVFSEDHGGFLAGALAAMVSESGKIGAVLGPDSVPPVWRYGEGYRAGAQYVDPDVEVIVVYHNVSLDKAFIDPEWGKATALDLISQDVDVIFGAGGRTGNGALLACAEEGVWAIGVDIDQYYTIPEAQGVLLTSAVKQLGPGTFALIKMAYEGNFPGGSNYPGAAGLAPYHDFEDEMPQEIKDEIADIEQGLKDGTVQTNVPPAKP